MPDVFISYSSSDTHFAEGVAQQFRRQNLSVFLACVSLRPGDRWSRKIHDQLSHSSWVIFLASRAACGSPYVQQEVGAAIALGKTLVPVVWDIDPSELPGWSNQSHASDIRGATGPEIAQRLADIGEKIRSKKRTSMLVGAGLLAGAAWWFFSDESGSAGEQHDG